jgi:hypothetical protein
MIAPRSSRSLLFRAGIALAIWFICGSSPAAAQVIFTISFDDSGSAHSAYYSNLTSHIQAAGARWVRFMNLGGP